MYTQNLYLSKIYIYIYIYLISEFVVHRVNVFFEFSNGSNHARTCVNSVCDGKGISVRTQELFLIVFVTRFLYFNFKVSINWLPYWTFMYFVPTAAMVYTIHFQEPIKGTYESSRDTFPHWKWMVAPCAGIALLRYLVTYDYIFMNKSLLLSRFAMYLDSIAIVPQLVVLQNYGECDYMTGSYIFFKGLGKALNMLYWILLLHMMPTNFEVREIIFCLFCQVMICVVFFGCYYKSNLQLQKKTDTTIQLTNTTSSDLLLQSDDLAQPLLDTPKDGTDDHLQPSYGCLTSENTFNVLHLRHTVSETAELMVV
jgi:ER lumen protein retaining receptor